MKFEGASHQKDTCDYTYQGKVWRASATTDGRNSFFHSVFGTRTAETEAYFDRRAKFRRMKWSTFLTYFENDVLPPGLREVLTKCLSVKDKYKYVSVEDKTGLSEYVSNISIGGEDVTVEEIPVLAALENVNIVVLSKEKPDPIIVAHPSAEILGDYPNTEKRKDEVVLCLEGQRFCRLNPVKDTVLESVRSSDGKVANSQNVKMSKGDPNNHLMKYDKGGSAGSKGVEFQVDILTLFLLNALRKLKDWKLSTENNAAGKFDDVVLESPEGVTLLQAKHKQNKAKKLSIADFMSVNSKNADFSLPKYFLAHQEIKDTFDIKNVIICTNSGVDGKVIKFLKAHKVPPESIFHCEDSDCVFYTFKEEVLPELKAKINDYYEKNYQNKGVDATVITDDNIKDFLNHLQLYSSFPPGNNLGKVVDQLVSHMKRLKSLRGQISSLELHAKLMNWFQQKSGVYLTEIYAKAIFSEIWTDKHWQRLEEYNVLFQKNDFSLPAPKRVFHVVIKNRHLLQEIKIYRALKNTKEKVLHVSADDGIESQKEAVEAFELPQYTVLVLICPRIAGDKLRNILGKYEYKKVILVDECSNKLLSHIVPSDSGCETIESSVSFEDLFEDTRKEMLNRVSITFQGRGISLEQLISIQIPRDYGRILNMDIMENLIKNKKIRVGVQPSELSQDISRFYIKRSFTMKIGIDNRSVSERILPEENIYEVADKVIVVSDTAGMGKSTVLTNLAVSIKKTNPDLWVIKIDLNDYTKIFKEFLKEDRETINITELLNSKEATEMTNHLEEFVFSMNGKVVLMLDGVDEISPHYTQLVLNLLIQCQRDPRFAKVFVTTRPHMIRYLEENLGVKPFSLQPFSERDQIDFLSNFWAFNLDVNIADRDKCERYAKALIRKMSTWIRLDQQGEHHFAAVPLQVRMLAEIFQQTNRFDESREWEGCKEYLAADGVEPMFPDSMNLSRLYEMFISKKRDVFIDKGNPSGNAMANQALADQFNDCIAYQRNLALELILDKTKCEHFSCYRRDIKNMETTMLMIGIVQELEDGFHFVHRTFAEYFVAKSLFEELQLQNQNVELQRILIDEIFSKSEFNVTRAFFDSFLQQVVDDLPSSIFNEYQSLSQGIDLSSRGEFNLIHQLAEEGCVAILRLLFKSIDYIVCNVKETHISRVFKTDGETSKRLFANNLDALKYLLQQGGLNIKDRVEMTPLHSALRYGHFDMVRFLVEQGASVQILRFGAGTLLHETVDRGQLEISKYLVDQGVDLTVKNGDGITAPYKGVAGGHVEIVKYIFNFTLKNGGLNVNNAHICYLAAYLGRLEVLENLIQHGTDVNSRVDNGETFIFGATRGGQLETIRYLVRQGADVNIKDDRDNTALHVISDTNSFKLTAKLLLEFGASFSMINSNGMIPPHLSALWGALDLVELFLDSGAGVNTKSNRGKTALYFAAERGHMDIIKSLLKRGADINAVDDDGRTALRAAVFGHHLDIAKYFIGLGMDVNATDFFGTTLLHTAAFSGQLQTVKFLEQLGVDINAKDNKGNTALYMAALWGHFDTTRFLVEHEADVNVPNKEGCVAVHLFASRGHLEIVKLLVRHNADCNARDEKGRTALNLAALRGHLDTVKYLVEQGVDIHVRDEDGCTALRLAALENHSDTVKFLTEHGVDVNARDNKGHTAFHSFASKDRTDMLEYLLDHGAMIDIRDNDGCTALHIAAVRDRWNTVKFLVEHGADINLRDGAGQTVLHLCFSKNQEDMVECLLEHGADISVRDNDGRTPEELVSG